MRRRKSREITLRMLYQMETNSETPGVALNRYCEIFPYHENIVDYARVILEGVTKERSVIDSHITDACDHWKIGRLSFVDRNILRIGIYEMLFSPDVPPKVAIDESIELAKKYGNENSSDFVNGVLDRIFRDRYSDKGH